MRLLNLNCELRYVRHFFGIGSFACVDSLSLSEGEPERPKRFPGIVWLDSYTHTQQSNGFHIDSQRLLHRERLAVDADCLPMAYRENQCRVALYSSADQSRLQQSHCVR